MMRNKDIHEKKGKKQGKVYLVGAGPGNPEYLTVRAMKLIRRCDVLLYDRLVDLEIVNLSSASCERICVGTDHGAEPSVKQDRINELMLDRYVRGMTVVRLKSGDPFIFGRGGEEVEFLRRNNVQYEIVPGLTSAISVATAAGIPLTHREHSSSVLIISGHRKGSGIQNDWSRIAKFDGTIVILMGVGASSEIASGLIENGMDPLTGVAVIENGTKPEQRVFSCFLREFPRMMQEFKIRAPSVIVIGRVINALIEGGMLPAVDFSKLTDMFSTPSPELSNTAAVTKER